MKTLKFVIIVFLLVTTITSVAQVIYQDQQIILTRYGDGIYIEPTKPNTYFIVNIQLNKVDLDWMEFNSLEYLIPYNDCIGKTLYLILYRYNLEGLNRIGQFNEVYLVGNYGFYIGGKL